MRLLRSNLAPVATGLAIVAVAGAVSVNQRSVRLDVQRRAEALTGGSVDRGQALFAGKGCGGCHSVSGVPQADGLVGPPLDGVAVRAVIAGKLANTPANLERWISAPQSIVPGNAMPDLPMTAQESRDIAAFLYTRI